MHRLHLSALKSVKNLPFLGMTADSALLSVYNFTVWEFNKLEPGLNEEVLKLQILHTVKIGC
ncbi:hypothetical protein B7P43_G00560 [Cryptotermes secundus]|uniref:Uncharacterized protein n=1 Tax=Cryptotermes secundus TaxID=105785 RepID=A0A2J7QY18_9NEOP|nr:hypothetical protein B7P43_G00560 [Cryptotermes secundus]